MKGSRSTASFRYVSATEECRPFNVDCARQLTLLDWRDNESHGTLLMHEAVTHDNHKSQKKEQSAYGVNVAVATLIDFDIAGTTVVLGL
jgi:hypothetical protein